jgi:hypothetical protein
MDANLLLVWWPSFLLKIDTSLLLRIDANLLLELPTGTKRVAPIAILGHVDKIPLVLDLNLNWE